MGVRVGVRVGVCVGWGGGIKAEGVCRLGLPGVRTRAPSEGGTLHSWMGGLVVHPLREVGSQMGHLTVGGKPFLLCESGTVSRY